MLSARAVRVQNQVAVALIGVGLLRTLVHLDDAHVDAARLVLERAVEEQVAEAVRRAVNLQRLVVDMLAADREVDAQQLGVSALCRSGPRPGRPWSGGCPNSPGSSADRRRGPARRGRSGNSRRCGRSPAGSCSARRKLSPMISSTTLTCRPSLAPSRSSTTVTSAPRSVTSSV